MLTAVLGLVLSISVWRVLSARYPGLQTLCRWVLSAASLAGLVLGGFAAVVAVHGGTEIGKAAAFGCDMVVAGQMAGWMLLFRWLPGREVAIAGVDERMLLQSLAEMTQFVTRRS